MYIQDQHLDVWKKQGQDVLDDWGIQEQLSFYIESIAVNCIS